METAITVNNLYIRYEAAQRRSFFQLLQGKKRASSLTALHGISFEVPKGEIIGIVGSNGSGKSTTLRTLAGLMAPTSGKVDLHGHSVSLLSLGTGFVSDLSGKDNIILCGLSMGFSRKEILEKYDDIVAFSELGDAIARPVKTYSSGMYSKLAFSIAVTLRTDIMLVDEVLSVGDQRFRKKSRAAMEELIGDKQRTVLIVSHNMAEIEKLCSKTIWLEFGRIRAYGETEQVLREYNDYLAKDPLNITHLDPPVLKVQSSCDKIVLRWNEVKHAEDYRIYRKENIPGAQWGWLADGYEGLTYEDVPPSKEMTFLYTIRARTTNINGDLWSDPGVPGNGKLAEGKKG
ncbi:MAG: ABC transporter ATP-binding protein [Ruminococcaceae bacterium]|nr:ABC transporter ATP-binding protein [Oscillospiraceae bacterium]